MTILFDTNDIACTSWGNLECKALSCNTRLQERKSFYLSKIHDTTLKHKGWKLNVTGIEKKEGAWLNLQYNPFFKDDYAKVSYRTKKKTAIHCTFQFHGEKWKIATQTVFQMQHNSSHYRCKLWLEIEVSICSHIKRWFWPRATYALAFSHLSTFMTISFQLNDNVLPVLEITPDTLKMSGQFCIIVRHDDRTSRQCIMCYILQGVVSQ